MVFDKRLTWSHGMRLIFAQVLGGFIGMIVSHLMFLHVQPYIIAISYVSRSGGTYVAEVVGTFILVLAIFSLTQQRSEKTSLAVGMLVGGMLLATSSTMFVNPQVTFARMFTYSAAGVSLSDGLVFIIMEFVGAIIAIYVWRKAVTWGSTPRNGA